MKHIKLLLSLMFSIILTSCSEGTSNSKTSIKEKRIEFLAFQKINLSSMSAFKKTSNNWKIVGNAYVDRNQNQVLIPSSGEGILVNIPNKESRSHLFTNFEHGDIELELDVMMPINSNSGIYFQGRYEVQLLDSWGVTNPESSDIGGLYKRWDETKKEEKERGFEGRAPNLNAAKAPGLWQHFKIIFIAPKFDSIGNKIINAKFEKVWLNGKLLHDNVEVSGPTRSAAFKDEVSIAPLMIQGDHGPVAFRNIHFKMYQNKKVGINDLNLKEYISTSKTIPLIDTLVSLRNDKVDSLTSNLISGVNLQRLLVFTGNFVIPTSGDYLFEMLLKDAGGILLINKDTIVNMDGDFGIDEPGYGKVSLEKGKVPFMLIYNRSRADQNGFILNVEGPNIQKYALTPPGSFVLKDWENPDLIMLESSNKVTIQRSFILHNDVKRTHCISVASPKKIHYSYDLAYGALLEIWYGSFLDVTNMWHSRGGEQIAISNGVSVLLHGDPNFAILTNKNSVWPDSIQGITQFKPLGYELNKQGYPTFLCQIDDALISDNIMPSNEKRSLERTIKVSSSKDIWHKIGEGNMIEKLPDASYAINDKNYFVDFSKNSKLNPIIRDIGGKMELLVKIPKGEQELKYNIIW